MALLSFLRLLSAILLLRPVLMAPPPFRPIAPNPYPGRPPPSPARPPARPRPAVVKVPMVPMVIELPVFFVVATRRTAGQNPVLLTGPTCLEPKTWTDHKHTRDPKLVDVGFAIGNSVPGHYAQRDPDRSIKVVLGDKNAPDGVLIGKLKVLSVETSALDRMWEELHGAMFISRLDFLQTAEGKLEELGEELKRGNPELGWEQSDAEKADLKLMFTRVTEMEEKEWNLEMEKEWNMEMEKELAENKREMEAKRKKEWAKRYREKKKRQREAERERG
ncbi:hypothetical protein F5878DRAFT_628668 [Lentinula raphanica]|uniref:Uncharacterized protein n=1 Tax=Lentinula raphanica TaxID=153919 RepID=A0AA38U9W5_9AGAR|nr:hypothetical protein F5878DRAFT_628668 [Lentinula raphanica]